jgi:hypothetical protein
VEELAPLEMAHLWQDCRFADPQSPGEWMYLRDLYTHFTPEHVNFFSLVSLRNLMLRHGFDEVRCEAHPLGVIAYETKSIWGGIIVHLGIAWMMEVIAFTQKSFST